MGNIVYNINNLKETRKKLRNNMTSTEKIIWDELKGKKLEGVKFRRQYGISRYIIDFYSVKHKLAIEIDGEIHDTNKENDKIRDEFLKASGIRVLRLKNEEVYSNIDNAIKKIKEQLI